MPSHRRSLSRRSRGGSLSQDNDDRSRGDGGAAVYVAETDRRRGLRLFRGTEPYPPSNPDAVLTLFGLELRVSGNTQPEQILVGFARPVSRAKIVPSDPLARRGEHVVPHDVKEVAETLVSHCFHATIVA